MLDVNRKEMLIARIQSAQTSFSFLGEPYLIRQPSLEVQEQAALLYEESFEEALFEGLITRGEALKLLQQHRIWTPELQKELDTLEEDIDKVKMKLYEIYRRKKERDAAHKILKVQRDRRGELLEIKHSLDFFTVEGFANWVKYRFLVRNSLSPSTETPEYLVDAAVAHLVSVRPTESEIREIARTEPWRSIWAAFKGEPKTEEHRTLICLSQMYDHIYEATDPPSDDVINDDDALDGWLIKRRKDGRAAQKKKEIEDGLSDKVAGSQEIFIMADSVEEAQEIEDLNDTYNKYLKKDRENLIKRKGSVGELELPDVQRDLQIELTRKFSQQMQK